MTPNCTQNLAVAFEQMTEVPGSSWEIQIRVCLVHRAAEEEAATRRVVSEISEIFEFALGGFDFHAALKCAEVSWFILFQQLCPPLKRNCSCSSGEIALSGSWFTSVVRISLLWLRGFGAIKIPSVTCCLLNDPLSLSSVAELHPGHERRSD